MVLHALFLWFRMMARASVLTAAVQVADKGGEGGEKIKQMVIPTNF